MKIRFFNAAIYMSVIVVLLEIALFLNNRLVHGVPQTEMSFRVVGAVGLTVGLWLQSSVARFCGGAFLAITAVGALWAVFSNIPTAHGFIWALLLFSLFYAFVALFGAYILLASQKFANEFRTLKENQSKYKSILGKVYLSAVILAALIASTIDIYCLADMCAMDSGLSQLRR
jgi:hypothetical protein